MTILIFAGEVPYLTTAQMIEVDRAMIEDCRIGLIFAESGVIQLSSALSNRGEPC